MQVRRNEEAESRNRIFMFRFFGFDAMSGRDPRVGTDWTKVAGNCVATPQCITWPAYDMMVHETWHRPVGHCTEH